MKKYLLDCDQLHIGDVICTKENAPISHTIRKVLSCEYSHVMIYVAHSCCIHADGDGVHTTNPQRMIFNDPSDVLVLRHKLAENMAQEELENICIYPRSKIGTEYSVADAVKAGISAKTKKKIALKSNYQYCSRLVAESFSHAGINFSTEPSLCTPADIQDHPDFKKVNNVVRQATSEELEFAEDKRRDKIAKQTIITNDIIKASQKILGKNVQTFNDIYRELVSSPTNDEKIMSLIQESGYLTMWADDIVQCPERYLKIKYQNAATISNLKQNKIRMELSMATNDIKRYRAQRLYFIKINEQFPRKVFDQQIDLYDILLSLAGQRQKLFHWLLKENCALNS